MNHLCSTGFENDDCDSTRKRDTTGACCASCAVLFRADTKKETNSVQNDCIFSFDRRYRYRLVHTWEPLFAPRLCTWIGLNPSLANETRLDPTLRRIRAFSAAWGYNGFIMTNLFGLVSTNPDRLYREVDPVGPENDRRILGAAQEGGKVIVTGEHQGRCTAVIEKLSRFDLLCLKKTKDGFPMHPLYVAAATEPTMYPGRSTLQNSFDT